MTELRTRCGCLVLASIEPEGLWVAVRLCDRHQTGEVGHALAQVQEIIAEFAKDILG